MDAREVRLQLLEKDAKSCISHMTHEQRIQAFSYWKYAREQFTRKSSEYYRFVNNSALAISVLFAIRSRKSMTNIAVYHLETVSDWYSGNNTIYNEWKDEPQDYHMDVIHDNIESYLEQAIDFVGSNYPWVKKRFNETY